MPMSEREMRNGTKEIRIRAALKEDAAQLLEIYAPYVRETAITFEYEVPSLEEFEQRIESTLEKYPYLVAETKEEIVGYAYASAFHSRAAYDWCAEGSIYLRMNVRGRGIGGLLYENLEKILIRQNICNLNVCIAYAPTEDEHLNNTSTRYHEKLGYRMAGHFHQCGYKFDTWYDMVWMEKQLQEHRCPPQPVIPYSKLKSPSKSPKYAD